MKSRLYEGVVRHRRVQPRHHEFSYRVFMPYIELDEVDTLFNGRLLWSARAPTVSSVGTARKISGSMCVVDQSFCPTRWIWTANWLRSREDSLLRWNVRSCWQHVLMTWREVGHHFRHHVPDADRYETLPTWARTTLEAHADDPRPAIVPVEELAAGRSPDPLWNAAQLQLVRDGRLGGAPVG